MTMTADDENNDLQNGDDRDHCDDIEDDDKYNHYYGYHNY